MRVCELMALLNHHPPEKEVRVACSVYEGSPSSAEDLPITGLTSAFRPASAVPIIAAERPQTLWIFAGRHLEVDESVPAAWTQSTGDER